MNKYINFVLTADSNYVNIIGITMTSILENLSKEKVARFFLFTQNFFDKDINELNKLKQYYNCEIINIPMDDYISLFSFADITKFKNNYISLACYFRLLMFKILPEDVEKCFYIDGDMIINTDLSELYLPDKKLIAVTIEPHAMQNREHILSHCYEMDEFKNFQNDPYKFPYFNAGFFYLNVKMAKEFLLFDKFMEFLNKNPNPPYADQDTLNAVIGQNYTELIKYLPPEYNLFSGISYNMEYNKLPYNPISIKYALHNPKIFHYAGQEKPWNTFDIKNFYYEYWYYYSKSPWKKSTLTKMIKTFLNQKKLRRNLVSFRFSKKLKCLEILHKIIFTNQFQNYLVSIIVASYNYQDYIKETLDSLLAQTYKNFEVIIVDDGSSDNSLDVIKEYTQKYDNFKLYTHDNNQNKGLAETLKLGISKAKGEYIAFCESDDYWTPDHLEEKINYINANPKKVIISNDIQTFGNDRCDAYVDYVRYLFNKKQKKKNLFKYFYNDNNLPTFSAAMVKTDILKKCDFNSYIPAWLDFWLWRQIVLTHQIGFIDKKLTYWRIHDNSYVLDNFDENNMKKNAFRKANNKVLMKKYPFRFALRLFLMKKITLF